MSSSADTITNCANCGKAESDDINLKRCTACKMVKYCSRDCQVAHRSKHKKPCKQRAAELFDEELFNDPPEGPECPICMIPLPLDISHTRFNVCCGKVICLGCVHAQMKEDLRNGKDAGFCEFCRAPPSTTDEEIVERLKKGVERNDATAMKQLALDYIFGHRGLQKDSVQAIELFRKAGENGCASAYGELGKIYCGSFERFQREEVKVDNKKTKHYWELAAIGGDMGSRYNLACFEKRNSNRTRASKHILICAKAGFEPCLQTVKLDFKEGYITKHEYAGALRAYQKQQGDRKSAMRDEALVYNANPSLYDQIS